MSADGYKTWLRKAQNDRLNIKNNLAAESVPWDTVCFHAQQVVEKMLKAVLLKYNQPVPHTHDLIALLARCVQLLPGLAELEAACRELTPYAVIVRYPDDLFEPTQADGHKVVATAERVYLFLLHYLK